MYTITKTPCPDRERTWLLSINGHQMGIVEIVHMTNTLRSLEGSFRASTVDREQINVTYDCEKVKNRVAYSINNFITDIQKVIGERELRIPRMLTVDAPEQIYVQDDVTTHNVDTIVTMLRIETPSGWNSQTPSQRVGYVQTFLRDERQANIENPMRDLVQRSKLAKTRATEISEHMKKHW